MSCIHHTLSLSACLVPNVSTESHSNLLSLCYRIDIDYVLEIGRWKFCYYIIWMWPYSKYTAVSPLVFRNGYGFVPFIFPNDSVILLINIYIHTHFHPSLNHYQLKVGSDFISLLLSGCYNIIVWFTLIELYNILPYNDSTHVGLGDFHHVILSSCMIWGFSSKESSFSNPTVEVEWHILVRGHFSSCCITVVLHG